MSFSSRQVFLDVVSRLDVDVQLDVFSRDHMRCQISGEDFLGSILSLDLGEEVAHILLKVSSVMRNERSR